MLTLILTALLSFAVLAPNGSEGPQRAAPLQPPSQWVTNDDYPYDALRRNAQGTVHYRVAVDEQGMPRDCRIEQTSGDESLDRTTCQVA